MFFRILTDKIKQFILYSLWFVKGRRDQIFVYPFMCNPSLYECNKNVRVDDLNVKRCYFHEKCIKLNNLFLQNTMSKNLSCVEFLPSLRSNYFSDFESVKLGIIHQHLDLWFHKPITWSL